MPAPPVSPPRVLVFGTGSVGAVYAWILFRAVGPANLYTVCRSNHAVASTAGFTINSTIFGEGLNFKPQVVRTVDEAVSLSGGKPFDYIVVTAKAIHTTPSIPEQLRPAIAPHTTIALIQNGIAIEEPYRTLYPDNPLLSCVVYLPATQTAPAVIVHREIELLHIGTYPSNAPRAHQSAAEPFARLLNAGGGSTELHEDVQPQRWSKLMVNASWNPVCALSRSRDAQFLKSSPPEYSLGLIKSLMTEIASIAQSLGYDNINADTITYQINRAKVRELPGVEPSMLADAKVGARMEVDAIVGNTVRLADERGVHTPLLRAIYALVTALDRSFQRELEKKTQVQVNDKGRLGEQSRI
ncbi:2-dehydropantoate 2-reductase [Cladophialophora psammophila CBS 110553]|uniref:2-dehydropantoate 2-reductase n=1 Tax=Cladophialophora psammophila CBS 110553 TaxID=1182543 RepID=W9VPN2_9EURO|nr:2-dehydropantoate 2-reductase [Cladophialophora psammophila CBS 110553]EXJ54965.1 2-dehydropantoate 2-reductase [Cladophialophora psammophila CBS 110553]